MDARQRRSAVLAAVAAAGALLLLALERPVAASQEYAIKQTLAASAVMGLLVAVCLGLAVASLRRPMPASAPS